MLTLKKTLALIALSSPLLSFSPVAPAASGCVDTARALFLACGQDAYDDFYETIANCINTPAAQRRACRREAYADRADKGLECRDQRQARVETCGLLGEDRYDQDPLLDVALPFIDPNDIPEVHAPNPYVSLQAGNTFVLNDGEETVIVTATDEVREILGVACRVVVDVVVETEDEDGEVDYEPVELTDDWFAQEQNGDVYYCGEIARNYEDGVLTDLDGSFEAGKDFAKSGLLIRAAPMVGDTDRQEYALAEAEDIIEYLDLAAVPSAVEGGDNPAFPCAPDGCLKIHGSTPLEPGNSEFKYFKAGVGMVLAVGLEDGEPDGGREQRMCSGDSLAILHDPACGIEDPDALLDALCELDPDTFCDNGDD